ncbi:hypothetical protein, partial [Stenoxybacter acetivorans]|uniref:hypothetical protein n=1 Tax=Stenoxybacter acetivorans TaxID=422441 RepID=UPI00056059FE
MATSSIINWGGNIADIIGLTQDVQQVEQYARNGGTKLDGLNTFVSGLSIMATTASWGASITGSPFVSGAVYQLNGSIASASLALAGANIDQGNYADAA